VRRKEMLDRLAAEGSVPLGCLTEEEMAAVGADQRTPFQPGEPPARLQGLAQDARRVVLATALRSLMARGLLEPLGGPDWPAAGPDGTVLLRPLGELETILGVRRAPAAVVFAGQRSFFAALHGFREVRLTGTVPGISGFLEERIDRFGMHHFTVRTAQNAIDTLAALADPTGAAPADTPRDGRAVTEISGPARSALRELGPGVTRLDAYHIRPVGSRRIQAHIVVRPGEVSVVWSASGVEPERPRLFAVTVDGLRRVVEGALRDPGGDPAQGTATRTGTGKDDGMAGTEGPRYQCPVCGYPCLEEPARFEDGYPSWEICPSCGFEFGYDDDEAGHSYADWRQQWIADGMPWRLRSYRKPPGWDPQAQLRALLESGPGDEADGTGS
jgi:hypothetical protein